MDSAESSKEMGYREEAQVHRRWSARFPKPGRCRRGRRPRLTPKTDWVSTLGIRKPSRSPMDRIGCQETRSGSVRPNTRNTGCPSIRITIRISRLTLARRRRYHIGCGRSSRMARGTRMTSSVWPCHVRPDGLETRLMDGKKDAAKELSLDGSMRGLRLPDRSDGTAFPLISRNPWIRRGRWLGIASLLNEHRLDPD